MQWTSCSRIAQDQAARASRVSWVVLNYLTILSGMFKFSDDNKVGVPLSLSV
jgi:hypothetical protein